MSAEIEVQGKLSVLARRLWWLTLEERVAWCALPGLVAALLLLAAHKLDRLDEPYVLMAFVVGIPLALGLLWSVLRRVSLLEAACLADRKLGLKERLSNAVVFAERPDASPLVPALLRDAAKHAENLSAAQVLPHRLPGAARVALVVAVLAAAGLFAPVYPLGRTRGELAVRQEMRTQGQRLRQIAQRVEQQAKTRKLGKPEELAKKLQKLAKELERAKLSKKEALLKSGRLAAELREAQRLAALQSGTEGLARAAEELRNVPFESQSGQDAARALREQRADELASKLGKLAQELRQGKHTSPQEQKQLADDLRKMAEAAEAAGMSGMAEALREASAAVGQGKTEQAAEALDRAAQAADQAAQAAAANQSMEQMAQELEQSQREVAQADQQSCPTHGSSCPNPSPGGG